MYSIIRDSNMPKIIKVILYIMLTITCVYWIGYLAYRILELIRVILHLVSEKGHWWFVIIVIIGVGIATLFIAQFCFGLNPFGQFGNWISKNVESFRNWLGNLVRAKG